MTIKSNVNAARIFEAQELTAEIVRQNAARLAEILSLAVEMGDLTSSEAEEIYCTETEASMV